MDNCVEEFWSKYFSSNFVDKKIIIENLIGKDLLNIAKLDLDEKTKIYMMAQFVISYFDDLIMYLGEKNDRK